MDVARLLFSSLLCVLIMTEIVSFRFAKQCPSPPQSLFRLSKSTTSGPLRDCRLGDSLGDPSAVPSHHKNLNVAHILIPAVLVVGLSMVGHADAAVLIHDAITTGAAIGLPSDIAAASEAVGSLCPAPIGDAAASISPHLPSCTDHSALLQSQLSVLSPVSVLPGDASVVATAAAAAAHVASSVPPVDTCAATAVSTKSLAKPIAEITKTAAGPICAAGAVSAGAAHAKHAARVARAVLPHATAGAPPKGVAYFSKYFLAGSLSGSFSHGVTVPFDVVKTRIQTRSEGAVARVKRGVIQTAREILDKEGPSAFLTGLGPTLSGFALHGSMKYGFYELFKNIFQDVLDNNGIHLERVLVYMVAGACAETIGSTLLTPFEAARIRLVSQPLFATSFLQCLSKIAQEEGVGSLYAGFAPILLKHIPSTVVQLSCFEFFTSSVYTRLYESGFTAENSSQYKFMITAICALLSGILSTLVSQPGDALFSEANKGASPSYNPDLRRSTSRIADGQNTDERTELLTEDSQLVSFAESCTSSFTPSASPATVGSPPSEAGAVSLADSPAESSNSSNCSNSSGRTGAVTRSFSDALPEQLVPKEAIESMDIFTPQTDLSSIDPAIEFNLSTVRVCADRYMLLRDTEKNDANSFHAMVETAKRLGIRGMYRGINARILHVSVVAVTQLLMYDYIKQLCGIAATGATAAAARH